jgi:hypothetical protein
MGRARPAAARRGSGRTAKRLSEALWRVSPATRHLPPGGRWWSSRGGSRVGSRALTPRAGLPPRARSQPRRSSRRGAEFEATIETRGASRIRPSGLVPSPLARTTIRGLGGPEQWQPRTRATRATMRPRGRQTSAASTCCRRLICTGAQGFTRRRATSVGTLESAGCDGRAACDRGPPRRGSLRAPPLRSVSGEDVQLEAHDDDAAQGARAGRPGRRGAPSSRPAAGRAAQPRLTGDHARPPRRRPSPAPPRLRAARPGAHRSRRQTF